MDDHDEGRDDVRDADGAWGIFWGAHGLRVSCRLWGHHAREPQGKDARGMDTARPAGPREVVARGHFPMWPGAMLRTGGHTALAPHFPVTQGQS